MIMITMNVSMFTMFNSELVYPHRLLYYNAYIKCLTLCLNLFSFIFRWVTSIQS